MTTFGQEKQQVENQINAGRDVIGRDQIIQNIVVVGRFLDFAKIEELLPKTTNFADFKSIVAAFENVAENHTDLTESIGFAGEILRDLVLSEKPQERFESVRFRNIIPRIARATAKKLIELRYWETFCERGYWINWNSGLDLEIIFLDSLIALWKKRYKEDRLFGIAVHHKRHFFDSELIIFMECSKKKSRKSETYMNDNLSDSRQSVNYVDLRDMNSEEIRIFLAGLVVDLIRIGSEVSNDHKLWDGLVSLFNQ